MTRFDPPSSTVQVGTIEGGTAPNIVPKTCKFQWQVRSLPERRCGLCTEAAQGLCRGEAAAAHAARGR